MATSTQTTLIQGTLRLPLPTIGLLAVPLALALSLITAALPLGPFEARMLGWWLLSALGIWQIPPFLAAGSMEGLAEFLSRTIQATLEIPGPS